MTELWRVWGQECRALLADRALSVALFAKSSGGKVKIYVSGCDPDGYLQGLSVMLVD